jgi:hypothetical protein
MTITMTDLTEGILPAGILTGVTRFTQAQSGATDQVVLVGAVTGSASINQQITTAISAGAVGYANIQNESSKTLLGNPTASGQAPSEITLGAGLAFSGTVLAVLLTNYIGGMLLSNDGTSPNTVLDIATGVCADSTNTVMIVNNNPFTKSISSTWTAGTGNGGLGNGLSLTASTTYHVFAIINNNLADYYFDTSVSAANAPTGTTAFRRIGSLLVNSSSHITTFTQYGDYFYINSILSLNTGVGNFTATLQTNVPLGISVIPLLSWLIGITSTGASSATTNVLVANFANTMSTALLSVECQANQNAFEATGIVLGPLTDTSGRLKVICSIGGAFASDTLQAATCGWIDMRGQ